MKITSQIGKIIVFVFFSLVLTLTNIQISFASTVQTIGNVHPDMQMYIDQLTPLEKEILADPSKELTPEELEVLKKSFAKSLSGFEGKPKIGLEYLDMPGLTDKENELLKSNPSHALKAKTAADAAESITTNRYGNGYNDWRDAFRHCTWNGIMSRDIGQSWAKIFGDAHEDWPGNPAAEKDMDLYNNAKGRTTSFLGDSSNNTTIANKCKALVDSGQLKRLSPSAGWTP